MTGPHGCARDPGCTIAEGAHALDYFYARHADDPLIIVKPPARHSEAARSARRALTAHPSFSRPPQRALADRVVRAGQPYPIQLARRRGYNFIANVVLNSIRRIRRRRTPDGRVPPWRALEAKRRAQAEGPGGVAAHRRRRCDGHDIVARTLADS
jgi:hypothetical protein